MLLSAGRTWCALLLFSLCSISGCGGATTTGGAWERNTASLRQVDRIASPAERCFAGERPCATPEANDCLEPVAWVTPAGVETVVYRFRDRNQWTDGGSMPLPHLLIGYMRDLRERYRQSREDGAQAEACFTQLRHQIAYLLSAAVHRNGALVWENEEGLAQALEQAEYAHYLASVAALLHRRGHRREARELAEAAVQMSAALAKPVGIRSGGVRSHTTTCDGETRWAAESCYWFHSRGVGIRADGPEPALVLNQHLHAVRDTLLLYGLLRRNPMLLGHDRTQEIVPALLERAAAGLRQLAFAGPMGDDGQRPPNIADFLQALPGLETEAASSSYWAFYEVDPERHVGRNIALRSTCHYHTHVLELVADIGRWIERNPEVQDLESGRSLVAAFDHLLGGRDDGSSPPSTSDSIHRMYRSEVDPSVKGGRRGCPQAPMSHDHPARRFLRQRFGDDG